MDETTNKSIPGAGTVAAGAKKRPLFFLFWAFDYYFFWLVTAFLTPPPVSDDTWFFVLVQIVFGGLWFSLHARRLRDAGYGVAPALGVVAIYLLAIGLLHLCIAFMEEPGRYFFGYSLDMIGRLVTFSRGFGDPLSYLAVLSCLALLMPPVFSVWCAVQSGRSA